LTVEGEITQAGIRRLLAWKKAEEDQRRRWLDGIKDMESFNVLMWEATRTAP